MDASGRQALQLALYAVWVAGALCILVSLYATQILPGLLDQRTEIVSHQYNETLKVTMFTVPEPFHGKVGSVQAQAIHSWLRFSPRTQVVLLGTDESLMTFSENLQPRVVVESDIDFTFSGSPLLNSIMARARSSDSDISVLIDPQFILIHDFIATLQHAQKLEHSWLMVAIAKSLNRFPFQLKSFEDLWIGEDAQPVEDEQVRAFVKSHGIWKSCTGRYLWAWSTENVPLHVGVMPSFTYGYGFHHEWLLNEALSSGLRFVFDATDTVMAFYTSDSEDTSSKDAHWEADINAHLAALYGSFYFRPFEFANIPSKLVRCGDQLSNVFRFVYPLFGARKSVDGQMSNLIRNVNISSDYQASGGSYVTSFRRFGLAWRETVALGYPCPLMEARIDSKGWTSFIKKLLIGRMKLSCDCNNLTELNLDCPSSKMGKLLKAIPSFSSTVSMSLESLLAKSASRDKVIVLSVVGNNYKDMLMNWVCRLRKLQITNFVVGAIDKELYEFALTQGLPVFMSGPSLELIFNDCHFGTECFKRVTKMKSRTVLQILQLGYKVLFSDVDVYWFKNPIDYLMSFGPQTVVAQSDEWNVTAVPNRPRRLNSGFYFAWSDASTITAFERIVKHASASNMSEQPSFYDVLCGEGGHHRIDDKRCLNPNINVTTHFLDRRLFPNGAYDELWEKKNVSEACRVQGCLVLHNNWVSGRQKKLGRQISSGLWDYDVENRICIRNWYTKEVL